MKHDIKVFFVALALGMIATYLFCYKFDNNILSHALSSSITYFYVGSYNDLSLATTKKNSIPSSVIYNDNGIYKVVIGAYAKKESIALMSSYFIDQGLSFTKEETKISGKFIDSAESYELLIKTSSKDYYENINNSLLKLFNEYI